MYEGDLEQISVDLKRVDPGVITIIFALAVYQGNNNKIIIIHYLPLNT